MWRVFPCVGSAFFAVEAGVRIRDATPCTQEKNKWLLPSHVREIPYLPFSEMDFTSAKKKHELMVEKQVTPMANRSNLGIQTTRIPAPTSEERKSFFYKYFWLYSETSSLVPCRTI